MAFKTQLNYKIYIFFFKVSKNSQNESRITSLKYIQTFKKFNSKIQNQKTQLNHYFDIISVFDKNAHK